jgi:2'-5' RNA ligase
MRSERAPTTRLFFAVMPDASSRERLSALADETARVAGGRASLADTLHLTVVFVGNVDDAAVSAIRDAGDAMRWERFAVSLDTLGSFARAGIAWAAPRNVSAVLQRINGDLVAALAARGVATETRPYRPHVTLARRCVVPLVAHIDALIDPPIAWDVDGIVLMSSRLLSEGPRYRPVASWRVPNGQ